jgi:hypothetical protein
MIPFLVGAVSRCKRSCGAVLGGGGGGGGGGGRREEGGGGGGRFIQS